MAVTARPPRRVRVLAQAFGLRGLAICSNGSVLYDIAADRLLRERRLSADIAQHLVTRLREAEPGVAFAIEAGAAYGCEPTYSILNEHTADRVDPSMRRGDALALCREGVTKLIVQHPTLELEHLLELTSRHAGPLATVTHSGSRFVEVAAAGVNKASALAQYCENANVDASAVIALGDMPNDLPMLHWAGHAVAVANAHASVLAEARTHALSNDQDGVAIILEAISAKRTAQ